MDRKGRGKPREQNKRSAAGQEKQRKKSTRAPPEKALRDVALDKVPHRDPFLDGHVRTIGTYPVGGSHARTVVLFAIICTKESRLGESGETQAVNASLGRVVEESDLERTIPVG